MPDKQLPQAIEIEQSVLGALLIEKDAILDAVEVLTVDSFYTEAHKAIYKEILHLHEGGIGIDLMSVTNALKKANKLDAVGGAVYLSELTNKVGSAANITYWCAAIREKWMLRELAKISNDANKKAYDESTDAFNLLNDIEGHVYNLNRFVIGDSAKQIGESIPSVIQEMEKAQQTELVGVPTYNTQIDRCIGGYRNADLNILAARPGQAKTQKALSEAFSQAQANIPVAFFSLEMKINLLLKRIYASEGLIETTNVNNGQLSNGDWQKINKINGQIENIPLYIDDESFLTIMTLRSKLRKLVSQQGVEIAYVDYLQLMSPTKKHQNREGEISEISRGLKAIASELNIPIIALSQLNREVDKRQPPKPKLSDLRESGSLEQDASVVMFLYWPKSYGLHDEDDPDVIKQLIYKNRHGALKEVPIQFQEQYGKFTEYQESETETPF